MNYRVLIADDEALARERLSRLVAQVDAFDVVAVLSSAAEIVTAVQNHAADICLLDIQMPELSGLEVAAALTRLERPPSIIFCTAHDDYALDAFSYQAIDYILKPVRAERLEQALQRAAALSSGDSKRDSVVINSSAGTLLVPRREVICLIAEDKYVNVICADKQYLTSQSLRSFEVEQPGRWLRIHRNALVAPEKLRQLKRTGAEFLLYLDGYAEPLQVSRRHLAVVRRSIDAG